MRVYVGVQSTPQGGASSLSSYIAKSKVDSEHEQLTETGARPLFSAHHDKLTLKEADHTLNPTGRELEKEEVIHVVISPEPGSLNRAGEDPVERHKTVREAIRATVRAMERVLNVRSLSWIAGFHENTKTPHVHVAVSRWALDAVTEKLRYIKHLPKSLLPHNTEDGGERRFLAGKIAEVFTSSLLRMLKPIRSIHLRDTQNGIDLSRSVLSRFAGMLQRPTPEQIMVGKWLESALMLATGRIGEVTRDEVARQYSELTIEVAKIDAIARANGTRLAAAYVPVERLEELVNAKAANVQIAVSSTQLRLEDEKIVSITTPEPTVSSDNHDRNAHLAGHENEKVVAVVAQYSEKQIARQPEKSINTREGNQERHERKQDVQRQTPKTRETVKTATVKTEEPPPVGKFTLLDLQNQIEQGKVALPLTEVTSPLNQQIRTVVVTKTGDGDSKVGPPVPAQTIAPAHPVVIRSQGETNEPVHPNTDPDREGSQEWQLDDDAIRKFPAIAFYHLDETLRSLGMDNVDKRAVLIENGHYFSPHVTKAEAELREAQIAFKISLDACLERKLRPDLDGFTRYLKSEIRQGNGSQVALMEQMNMVRDSLEDITSPANHRLFEEYERLHNLYPDLRPKSKYEDLYQTRELSHERTDRSPERELEHETH